MKKCAATVALILQRQIGIDTWVICVTGAVAIEELADYLDHLLFCRIHRRILWKNCREEMYEAYLKGEFPMAIGFLAFLKEGASI